MPSSRKTMADSPLLFREEEYPYTSGHTGRTGDCQYDAESQVASAYNRGYETLPHNDFDVFMEHVATKGPLAISSDASRWSFYSGGVFDGCSYDKNIEINHAIQVNFIAFFKYLLTELNFFFSESFDKYFISLLGCRIRL